MTDIECDVPLALRTSLRIGGPAAYYCEPRTEALFLDALAWACERHVSVFVLGRGTNICLSDRGWDGLVINCAAQFNGIAWEGNRAVCLAGTSLQELVVSSTQRGFSGIEMLAGIPGSVGGAVSMNAGAFGQSFGSIVESVKYADCVTGNSETISVEELNMQYRKSIFKNKHYCVLGVTCRFEAGDSEELGELVRDTLGRRRHKQPLDKPNCGSVFKNPPERGAGRLIEGCGLKGYFVGGAKVSNKHANFIVNTGGATALEFRAVVRNVQRVVYEQRDVLLEPEVLFVGDFDEPLFYPTFQ